MSVVNYNIPHRERLLCEAPGCNELATTQAQMGRGTVVSEIFGCQQHVKSLTTGYMVRRIVKLDTPGERNPEEEAPKGASK